MGVVLGVQDPLNVEFGVFSGSAFVFLCIHHFRDFASAIAKSVVSATVCRTTKCGTNSAVIHGALRRNHTPKKNDSKNDFTWPRSCESNKAIAPLDLSNARRDPGAHQQQKV
jgi:hypothetical protein